jgi:hypothetical protein
MSFCNLGEKIGNVSDAVSNRQIFNPQIRAEKEPVPGTPLQTNS